LQNAVNPLDIQMYGVLGCNGIKRSFRLFTFSQS